MDLIQGNFYYACGFGHLDRVKHLVYQGADFRMDNQWAILVASRSGHLDVVKYLVSIGANFAVNDNYPLRWASKNGQLDVVKYLVSKGADVTARNNIAVCWASENGHFGTVKFLLLQGADFNQLTLKHKTYFKEKRAYSRWRRVHLKAWIRRVLIPLYFSPQNRGGIQAKKELQELTCT